MTNRPLRVWYHAALMPGWLPIVHEQMSLANHCGIHYMNVCAIGNVPDVEMACRVAQQCGVCWGLQYQTHRYSEYEYPTLYMLWEDAKKHPEFGYLYWHTKGVSAPCDIIRRRWRWALQRWNIVNWQDNIAALDSYDLVGANWHRGGRAGWTPHFAGNFWMARGEWINQLANPSEYRDACHAKIRNARRFRFYAERCVCHKDGFSFLSHVSRNKAWGHNRGLPNVEYKVDGFSYKPYGDKSK